MIKSYLISGFVDGYRIKVYLMSISPDHAIKIFNQKYPNARDIFVIQDLSKFK